MNIGKRRKEHRERRLLRAKEKRSLRHNVRLFLRKNKENYFIWDEFNKPKRYSFQRKSIIIKI